MKPPRHGPRRLRHEWREWGRCVLACVIAGVTLVLLSFVVGTPERTEALWAGPGGWLARLGLITGIWFLVGPLWTTWSAPVGTHERGRT